MFFFPFYRCLSIYLSAGRRQILAMKLAKLLFQSRSMCYYAVCLLYDVIFLVHFILNMLIIVFYGAWPFWPHNTVQCVVQCVVCADTRYHVMSSQASCRVVHDSWTFLLVLVIIVIVYCSKLVLNKATFLPKLSFWTVFKVLNQWQNNFFLTNYHQKLNWIFEIGTCYGTGFLTQ